MTDPAENPPPSRWTALPSDPPELRRWLAIQSGETAPEDWPQEETR